MSPSPTDLNQDPEALRALEGQSRATDRWLASHPRAPDDLLDRLSKSSDRITRRNVAANANTPKAVLIRLAPTFPAEFFLNPQFDWLLLEDPTLLDGLPVTVFKHILKRPDCPPSLIEWGSRHGSASLQLALASREDVALEVLRRIAASRHVKAAERAARRLLTVEG